MGDGEIFEKYSHIAKWGPVRGIPATILVDRGRMWQRFLGLTEKGVLGDVIRTLL